MSPGQDLDLRIQFSLVEKIKSAAHDYRSAHFASSSEALERYVSALEDLAEYVGSKAQGDRPVLQFPSVRRRSSSKAKPHHKHETTARIIPFVAPSSGPSPCPAA